MVMQEVRQLLIEGQSSSELINMGYAPGTVYKVQRQVRKRGKQSGSGVAINKAETPPTVADEYLRRIQDLEAQTAGLGEQLDSLEGHQAELGSQLDAARAHIQELEEEELNLKEQVGALEPCYSAAKTAVLSLDPWPRETLEHSSLSGFSELALEAEVASLVAQVLGYR